MRCDTAIARLLLETSGTELLEIQDKIKVTPLFLSCWSKHDEVTEVLLSFGADLAARSGGGETPLHYAARKGNYELTTILLEKDVDVHLRDENGEPNYTIRTDGIIVKRPIYY